MIKRLIIAVLLLGLVVGGIVWFKFFRDEMIAQYLGGMVPAPVPVTTQVIEPVTWRPSVEAVGTALSAQGVDLAIESGGLVREVRFKANDKVSEGQVLVQIDDDSERAALAAAEATLKVAEAEAGRAQTLQARGVGAANTAESAAAQTESARAQVAQNQTALDRKTLTAPFAGEIGIPRIEVGEYVAVGQIYATLQDLSQMRVDFAVPEQQLSALKLGGEVTVHSEVTELSAEGKIIGIEPRIDPNSRMVSVRAQVDNKDGKLVPGQFLRVKILQEPEEGVISVPQSAVSSTLYGDTIYVLRAPDAPEAKDGAGEKTEEEVFKAEQVFVELGRRSGSQIEVTKGLAAGDQIVTSGQNRLTNGARVKIDNSVVLPQAAAE